MKIMFLFKSFGATLFLYNIILPNEMPPKVNFVFILKDRFCCLLLVNLILNLNGTGKGTI